VDQCLFFILSLTQMSQPGECWKVPEPDLNDSQPFQSRLNIWLDNAEHELVSLLLSQPYEARQQLHDISLPVPAERELSRALGCQDCESAASGHLGRAC
jgi:hypothetical protein